MWKGYEPGRIAESAASALVSMLDAEFIYVGLPGERDDNRIDVVKTAVAIEGARLSAIVAAVKLEIRGAGGRPVMTTANPLLGKALRLAIAPIGLDGIGVIVAGAQGSSFPTETQRLLLGTAANEAALGLHRWQSETETRRFVALVESSSDFVGYADLDGTARYVNPAGMRLVGLPLTRTSPGAARPRLPRAGGPASRARRGLANRQAIQAAGLASSHFAISRAARASHLIDWFRIDDSALEVRSIPPRSVAICAHRKSRSLSFAISTKPSKTELFNALPNLPTRIRSYWPKCWSMSASSRGCEWRTLSSVMHHA